MFWNLKESSVAVNGGMVDYAVFGKGQIPLVIIPGLSLRDVKGAGVGLALMYKIFAKDYRVYIFDKNSEIAEGYSVSDLADDTAKAMRALGIENASVLGVSLGGMIAQELAAEYPELVGRLILGVTASRINITLCVTVGKWISFAEKGDFGSIVEDMLDVMYSEQYVKRNGWLFPTLSKFAKPKDETRFIRLAKACLTCDTYDRLKKIKCPTLVLGGADDRVVTGGASVEIAEKLGCAIHMYEGLGHSAYEEAEDFNERILAFLRSENERSLS